MTPINRRDFLKVLSVVPLSPLAHATADQRRGTRKVYLVDVPVAGFYYYDGWDEGVFDNLCAGDELELRREPDNPHDRNAIEVYTEHGHKLGYVPRISNPIPAAVADQEVAIGAEVLAVANDPDDYPAVVMRLYMIIPE